MGVPVVGTLFFCLVRMGKVRGKEVERGRPGQSGIWKSPMNDVSSFVPISVLVLIVISLMALSARKVRWEGRGFVIAGCFGSLVGIGLWIYGVEKNSPASISIGFIAIGLGAFMDCCGRAFGKLLDVLERRPALIAPPAPPVPPSAPEPPVIRY